MIDPPPAQFDLGLGAWILSTYADVSAALHDPRLTASGTSEVSHDAPSSYRESASRALSQNRVTQWRAAIEDAAVRYTEALEFDQTVDLVSALAVPFSHAVAAHVSGATAAEVARLIAPARDVFLAAAFATSADAQPHTHRSIAALSTVLTGPDPTIAVQSFVALSHTLPSVLAGAWLALLHDAELVHQLRATPGLMPRVVDELLRVASTSRAVFRRAEADRQIGGADIRAGDSVILMIAAANRDPLKFPDPMRVDLTRAAVGHLALGIGVHPCLGASLVRIVVTCATTALLAATTRIEPVGAVEWLDGFAIRAPATLPVVLRSVHGVR